MCADDRKSRQWNVNARETLYRGLYQIDRVTFRHTLHAGGDSGVVQQELFVRGDVVGVIPYDPLSDCIVLVEEFRIGAMHQHPDPWLISILAGMIDTDETPEQAAIREAREEAGLTLGRLRRISHYLASPAASTEEVHVYYAETDLSGIGGHHGLQEENEDIRTMVVPVEQAFDWMEQRIVRNSLSLIALQWLKLERAGLNGLIQPPSDD